MTSKTTIGDLTEEEREALYDDDCRPPKASKPYTLPDNASPEMKKAVEAALERKKT